MATNESIEDYLLELEYEFDRVSKDVWVVFAQEHAERVAVCALGDLVTFRMKLFDLPKDAPASLMRRLLEINATESVYGAFGIEGDSVVLTDSLPLPQLDLSELRAVLDSFHLTAQSRFSELRALLG